MASLAWRLLILGEVAALLMRLKMLRTPLAAKRGHPETLENPLGWKSGNSIRNLEIWQIHEKTVSQIRPNDELLAIGQRKPSIS